MNICEDCGTKLSSGRCPNCQEELIIFEDQNEYIENLSEDFSNKVKQQREYLDNKKVDL